MVRSVFSPLLRVRSTSATLSLLRSDEGSQGFLRLTAVPSSQAAIRGQGERRATSSLSLCQTEVGASSDMAEGGVVPPHSVLAPGTATVTEPIGGKTIPL